MKYWISCLLLVMMATANAQSKTEQKITERVTELQNALINADSVSLEKLAHNDLSYGHSSGQIDSKASLIRKLTSGQSDFVSINITGQTITISRQTALVRHKLDAVTNDNGKPGEVHLFVLLVWQKISRNWKLLARQAVKQAS
jgi:DNA mismatch repair protein MutH